MRCEDIDPIVEELADGSLAADAARDAHIASCARCSARLANARAIHSLLVSREVATPSAGFTAAVMARVVRERWQAERAIDIGFNLMVAAGILILVGGAAGLAWSAGLFTFTVDIQPVLVALTTPMANRVVSQLQTVLMAAAILTTALGLWWWAEADGAG
jgi:anti-sigma factor RsiW